MIRDLVTAPPHRRGSILLFLLGLITVMLITAFAFLRNMQMSAGASQVQRKDELARHAAQMGMQHALAVCLHEYAMARERRDGVVISGSAGMDPDRVVTRPDGPSKNVFQPLSPLRNDGTSLQPPQSFDLEPDASFQYLFGRVGPRPLGWRCGFTANRGVARYFEANRWDYAPSVVYDPASYDDYDASPLRAPDYQKAAPPVAGGVSSPFPPVDPFENGALHLRPAGDVAFNALDNPLLMDADCRPVSDVRLARYRLRYAVTTYDMSAALWMNTDMPWLDDLSDPASTRKQDVRMRYRDVINGVGHAIPGIDMYQATVLGDHRGSLESVFLGYGAISNSRFFNGTPGRLDGVPYDWPTRQAGGFSALPAGSPMAYRTDQTGYAPRWFHNVLGSPYMNGFDPGHRWLGSALASYTDLAFALSQWAQVWERDGQNPSNGAFGAQASLFAQRSATPFGRPYDGDEHPWAVNVLAVSPKVLQAMVQAYVPPAARRSLVTTETQSPRYRYVFNGHVVENWGSMTSPATATPANATWTSGTWTIPASANQSIPGSGIDLFTDAFRPHGLTPFAYAEPANRDYWGSAMADRPLLVVADADARSNLTRYPGEAFFTRVPAEAKANKLTRWLFHDFMGEPGTATAISPRPRQVHDDASTLYPAPATGSDHLGRHIVFYAPAFAVPAVPLTQETVLGTVVPTNSYATYQTAHAGIPGRNWGDDFAPTGPFSMGAGVNLYSGGTSTIYLPATPTIVPAGPPLVTYRAATATEDYGLAPELRGGIDGGVTSWKIDRTAGGVGMALNSYWQRVTLAFVHAVLVTQVANLAWADPQDTRSQTISTGNGRGPTYNVDATRTATVVCKTPGGDPKAVDFATPELIDRQFLANLGESFDHAGVVTPADVCLDERPPRFLRSQNRNSGNYPGPTTFAVGNTFNVAEYRVTNNIRTLLTPIDTSTGATLTPRSSDPQTGVNRPPRNLWLLDEWNAAGEPGYTPSTEYVASATAPTAGSAGPHPTALARARAKLMERVLNDWRMSFLGSGKAYAASFRPKDFDGDGRVFCSGYAGTAAADADTGLTCWAPVEAGVQDGPGQPTLTVFSVTGCLTFTRSHQYKIHVRGELFDDLLNKAVNESYLEGAVLIDPDNDIVRSGVLPTGLEDSTVMMQHPIPSTYRGLLPRSYP